MRTQTLLLASLVTPLTVEAQTAVVTPWSMETCSVPTTSADDVDLDGLVDECEYSLARAFEPVLIVYDTPVDRATRIPHWSTRPTSTGRIQIYYAAAYTQDYGSILGISGHRGDSEFIVAEILNVAGSTWEAQGWFLSQHYHASTDTSGWFPAGHPLQYYDASHPTIHVARDKHAHYRTSAECNDGGWRGSDECVGPTANQWLGVHRNNSIGSMLAPINPNKYYDLDANGIADLENFWTDVRFCGWQDSGNTNRSRWTCASSANTYYNQLGNLEFTGCEGSLSTGSLEQSAFTNPPNGVYYAAPGRHVAHLAESRSGNLILSLWRWTGQQWLSVATDNAWGPSKTIDYSGPAGYYVWQVWAALGSGDYTMCSR